MRGGQWSVAAMVSLALMVCCIGSAASEQIRIISETDGQVIFEVITKRPSVRSVALSSGDYQMIGQPSGDDFHAPGAPELPVIEVELVLPPGTEAVATVLGYDQATLANGRPLPRATNLFAPNDPSGPDGSMSFSDHMLIAEYVADPVIYNSLTPYPARWVEAREGRNWRHLRYTSVQVSPVRYFPENGRIDWYERIRIQVNFIATTQAQSNEMERIVGESEPRWEHLYKKRFLNYERAKIFKRAPVTRHNKRLSPQAAADFEVRFHIDHTDLYQVTYDDLADIATLSEPIDWQRLSLAVRDYVEGDDQSQKVWAAAYAPIDVDDDGLFGTGDKIVFYGQNAWDFFDLEPKDRRYNITNVYWLVVSDDPGEQMDSIPSWYDQPGLTPMSTYRRTEHFEENHFYGDVAYSADNRSTSYGPFALKTDHYNWTHPDPTVPYYGESVQAVEINLPVIDSIESIAVHLQGQTERNSALHRNRLWWSRQENAEVGTLSESDTAWAYPGNPYIFGILEDTLITVDSDFPPTTALNSGRNYLKIYIANEADDIDQVDGGGAGLDWVEVTYRGDFRVLNNRLFTEMEATGIQQIKISSLSNKNMMAFDVTDSLAPQLIPLPDSLFSASGSRWKLNLQIDFGETTAKRKVLFIEPDFITPLVLEMMTLRNESLPSFTGQDLITIYPAQFAPAITPLLTHREGQGHQVMRAPLEAVFDQYSGGRPHVFAIKYMMRDLWRSGETAPDYLLLVGDASNDIAGFGDIDHGGVADINILPVVTVPGFQVGLEAAMVSCDHWFVDNLAGNFEDRLSREPDLHLGRIPCSNNEELEIYVNKVLDYELNNVTDSWRNRIVVHSDDQFSISGTSSYLFKTTEDDFITISNACFDSVRAEAAFAHYDLDTLYQSIIMDSVVSLGRCVVDPENPDQCLRDAFGEVIRVTNSIDISLSQYYGRYTMKDIVLETLSRGALIWSFQGHSNRKLLTHENVFLHYRVSTEQDVFDLTNVDRPFIFIGAGCHLAEYATHTEADPRTGGDGMTELMLFCCSDSRRGAIAIYASSDYETIGHRMEEHFFDAMFTSPPVMGENGAARWRLGDVTTASKQMTSSASHQRLFYTLLGDPALRVGISPPVMDLTLNGDAWLPENGDEYISDREDDSLRVLVNLMDDSSVPVPAMDDYFGSVPTDSFTIVSQADDGRYLTVAYDTQIQRRPYSLTIRANDYDGSLRETAIAMPMETALFEKSNDQLVALSDGALIEPVSQIVATIRTGAHLSADDVELIAGAVAVSLVSADLDQTGGANNWTLTFDSLLGHGVGPIDLVLNIRQRDGEMLTLNEYSIELGEDDLYFKSIWWIPSPFAERATLVYDLSLRASKVRLKIFTASGRCILDQTSDDGQPNLTPSLPVAKGIVAYDAPVWNGRDDDGDEVANGLYFYELTVWGDDGQEADKVIEKLLRVR
jgi:Peptidase family C25/Propeptide_C25